MISAFPVSGAWQPKITGAQEDRPSISLSRQSLTCPWPCPPSAGSRCVAHSPWSLTACLSGSMTLRTVPLGGVYARWGQMRSSGSTSSRTNAAAQPASDLLRLNVHFAREHHPRLVAGEVGAAAGEGGPQEAWTKVTPATVGTSTRLP